MENKAEEMVKNWKHTIKRREMWGDEETGKAVLHWSWTIVEGRNISIFCSMKRLSIGHFFFFKWKWLIEVYVDGLPR